MTAPSSSMDIGVPAAVRSLPRIALLTTGGTIAGAAASESDSLRYAAGALGGDALLRAVPALARIAQIETIAVAAIDSKDADPAFWCALTETVRATRARDDIDGIVITHGTDTLEESAYWLDLMLAAGKPVVLTAAMRPATALSADGPANLFDAVTLAGDTSARDLGVLVTLQNRIHAARDIVKVSSHALDAFASPAGGPLGWVQDGRVGWLRRRHLASLTARDETGSTPSSPLRQTLFGEVPSGASGDRLEARLHVRRLQPSDLPDVEVVVQYGGASPHLIDALLTHGVRGIVVAGTGNGTVNAALMAAMQRAVAAGVIVIRSSRAADVHVSANAAVDDDGEGFVASGTLNPYKARIRLMLALAVGLSERSAMQACFNLA
ncbi:asparaginase [Robbsia sp. KACC 23696]|uniref:asparaginase n=1 Tax=Robbsia sp. KACC 23696 TaxID=3149231 RepID=UPI00325C1DBE